MPQATISGRIMIRDLADGTVIPGDAFTFSFSDDCCEGHAVNSCEMALQGYLDWHNKVSIDKDSYQFFADEWVILENSQSAS
jgi:hypothetical protein